MPIQVSPWLETLRRDLRKQGLDNIAQVPPLRRQALSAGLHLAVFVSPFLDLVLKGSKRIESRFSKIRCAPFRQVHPGDILLLKRPAGPIEGVCRVTKTWYFEGYGLPEDEIVDRFAASIGMTSGVLRHRIRRARFASLFQIADSRPLKPIWCAKKDRRGWVVVGTT